MCQPKMCKLATGSGGSSKVMSMRHSTFLPWYSLPPSLVQSFTLSPLIFSSEDKIPSYDHGCTTNLPLTSLRQLISEL